MKRIILSVFALLLILSPASVFAAATTPTPTQSQAVTTQIEQQINNLKDKIASKVAQLKLVEKQGIIGTVSDISGTQITVKDITGTIHFIDVDELTKFSSPDSKTNFGISDITKNTTLGILGLYNKESRRILARFITVLILPHYIHGAVAAIDKTNFTLTVAQNDGSQTVVEIEDVTKISSYNSVAGVTKSGFSKIQLGERVSVVGFVDKQDAKKIITSRIIVFPNIPINPALGNVVPAIPTAASSPSATPKAKLSP